MSSPSLRAWTCEGTVYADILSLKYVFIGPAVFKMFKFNFNLFVFLCVWYMYIYTCEMHMLWVCFCKPPFPSSPELLSWLIPWW